MTNDSRQRAHRHGGHWSVRVLQVLVGVLILKVVVSIVSRYGDYLPPDFASDFLFGRDSYFFGPYRWAFYVHIASGPVSLLLGLILISDRVRNRWPRWHRRLGRVQVLNVLLLVAPSGLWMSFSSQSGLIAGLGFGSLAIATACAAATGWRLAVQRKFARHRIWMWRCFLLLNSAIVLRLLAGLQTVLNIETDWNYPLNAWLSWLLPLGVFEVARRMRWVK